MAMLKLSCLFVLSVGSKLESALRSRTASAASLVTDVSEVGRVPIKHSLALDLFAHLASTLCNIHKKVRRI